MRFFKHLRKGSMNVPGIFQNFAAFNSNCIDIITTVIFGYLSNENNLIYLLITATPEGEIITHFFSSLGLDFVL